MFKTNLYIFIFIIVDFGNGECCLACILTDFGGYCADCTYAGSFSSVFSRCWNICSTVLGRCVPASGKHWFSCCGIGSCNIFCCNCDYGICVTGACCAGFSFLNYHQHSNKSSAETILNNLDKNRDQKLSFEEISSKYGSHYDLKVEFPLHDKNNDGFITVDEIDSDVQKAKI